jgi:hypothetical protein
MNFKKNGDYEYYETPDDQDVYYVNIHRHASFFMTRDKTIIHGSRYYSYNHEYEHFAGFNQQITDAITEEDLENAIAIGDQIISICKWFVTYGHFMDEAFALCDFRDHFPVPSTKVLLDYHTDDAVIENYPVYSNYKIIDGLLFGKDSVNAYSYGLNILKMKKLYLIRHAITDKTFHAFPMYSRNKILHKILPLPRNLMKHILRPMVKLFITRGFAKHINRNLDNESEIALYLTQNNYTIINPEEISFDQFVRSLYKATHIVMNWGGALTNMCYCSPQAKITILKSRSYEFEKMDIFHPIIQTYLLNIHVVLHKNNQIEIPFL